ncbi:hypothetical protein [Croceivirga radicis]|uniref:hypothetical protein n=1 Tax=Croceivirga radicis TaxID=1929488 RepID=UPI000255B316|nr:hypothetical protein [Croceivirga radicis]
MASSRYIITLLIIVAISLLAGCNTKTFETKEELWSYLKNPENGYQQAKTINGVTYSLTFKPTDLLVKQELNSTYSKEDVESLRTKYRDYLYFILSISTNNQEILSKKVSNRAEFGAMVSQLAFGMGDKVNLITFNKDTLDLLDYVYPRMYGMSNSTDLLLVYKKNDDVLSQQSLRFTLEDLGLGSGEVGFNIDPEKILQQPSLSF